MGVLRMLNHRGCTRSRRSTRRCRSPMTGFRSSSRPGCHRQRTRTCSTTICTGSRCRCRRVRTLTVRRCTTGSRFARRTAWTGCGTPKADSGWITASSWSQWIGAGFPASWYNQQYYWGVQVSNQTSTNYTLNSSWLRPWKLVQQTAAPPQLQSPVDGFRVDGEQPGAAHVLDTR